MTELPWKVRRQAERITELEAKLAALKVENELKVRLLELARRNRDDWHRYFDDERKRKEQA